jgi:hypothetical protein
VLFPVPFLLTKRVVLFCNMVFRTASDASGSMIMNRPQFAGGSEVSIDGAYGKK